MNIPYKNITSSNKCTGCMVCVDTCNKGAIVITKTSSGLYPKIDTEKCINCNACKKVCPAINETKRSNLKEMKCFATWSKNDSIRLNAASGGFCTQLGVTTIERGGYVATVVMENNRPKYILTNNINELLHSSNSKYVQGNPSGIYRKVREVLKSGKEVLFVGLPCYCAALKNFLKREYTKLTTIELVCSAPASVDTIDKTLKELNASEFIAFRSKFDNNMWGEGKDHNIVIKQNGKKRIFKIKEAPFYNYFASLMTARRSCTNCQFTRLNRVADFTAADFHGYRCEYYEKGVNLVIASNSNSIDKLTAIKDLHIIPETWSKAVNSNPRLYNGYDFLRWHPVVIFREKLAGTNIFNRFCLNKNLYRAIWLPFKAVTKIIIKLKYRKAIKIAESLDNRL